MTFPDRLLTNFELVLELPSNKPFDVFLVKDRTKDLRPCVLRILPDSLSRDRSAVDAFMAYFSKFSEIINRAYIPSVYSISGQAGGNVHVLEEHVPGIDLNKFIQKNGSDPDFNREIISIAGKVCEALHHAHQKDIFHLAITPEDIFIDTSTGRVKLVGFGVQVFAQINKTDLLYAQARKTIAPEVLTGDPLRPRADAYSLAKVMNEACPEVFAGSDVLSKALSNDPSDRYQSARDFEGALNDALEKISRLALSRNIDAPLEAKGGLKPVLTEKPVTVEREVYQSPPRKPNTPQSQPQIKPDSVPVTPEPETPKSISMKLVAAIAAGVLAIVIGLAVYVSHEKQSMEKEHEIAARKDAQKIAAMEKDRIEKERQAAIEKERLEKELEASSIKEAERLAAIEKANQEKEAEAARKKEAQRLADLYKERIEREKREQELEAARRQEADRLAALENANREKEAEIVRMKEQQRLADLYKERIERENREKEQEIARMKEAEQKAALEKVRIENERQAAIEKERQDKEREIARKEAERLAAIDKEKLEKEKEIEQRKESQRPSVARVSPQSVLPNPDRPHSDRIAAIVNSDVIHESDVKKQKQPLIRSLINLPLGIVPPGKWPSEREILDELIVIHLLEQEAAKRAITLDDKAVDASIESIKKRNNLSDEKFALFLASNGLTYSDYRQIMVRQFRLTKLIDSEVTQKTSVSEEDAQKYFKKHQSEINDLYQKLLQSMAPPQSPEQEGKPNIPTHEEIFVGGKIRLRQITLKTPGGKKPADIEMVMETAQKIYREAQTGQDFGELAKKYSQDTLAKSGGDLGFMDYRDMVPNLQKMVQRMKVGDLTPPLKTADSILMFYLDDAKDRKEETVPIPEKTRKELEKRWKQEYEKKIAEKKSQSAQRRETENLQTYGNKPHSESAADSSSTKSLGILTPEEITEYQKVRSKVIAILRSELTRSRMAEWTDGLKRNSIIKVKL